jgi:ABC-2 type transport system ATP-binding protein
MVDVSKSFGSVQALHDVNLEVERGTIVGIIGPSGAGKTTAIRLILGLYGPTSGRVRVNGVDPTHFSRADRERIGYLPQHFLLYPELTVEENLEFVAAAYGLGWRARKPRITSLLDLVKLTDAANRKASNISGGMQRRLALASALIHDPEFLVLDEPTAGIDPILRHEIWDVFRQLQAEGRTFVVTTQYVTEAEFCDRVALINDGQVAAYGTPNELRQMAFGGQHVRVVVPDLSRELARQIDQFPLVVSGQREGDDAMMLVVEDAGKAIPMITERLRDAGHPVASIEEYREPFDQVFVALLRQYEASRAHEAAA